MELDHRREWVTVGLAADGHSGVARWRELLKLRLRAWWHRCATADWLAEINATELLRSMATMRPRLLIKIYRPYLTNTLSAAGRVSLLRSHYQFIRRRGLGGLSLRAALAGVTLASVCGKSGRVYSMRLHAVEPMEREGELVLQLFRGDQLVYSTAFVFFQDDARMMLGIGCMQGPKLEGGLELMRDATRDLYGLRPKQLMLKLLGAIGHQLRCAGLRLVGNDNRAVCRAQRQGKVHADYDAFWRECGATRRGDGDFQLGCHALAPPDLAAIPSNKRSAARQRHRLCEMLMRQIGAMLDEMAMNRFQDANDCIADARLILNG